MMKKKRSLKSKKKAHFVKNERAGAFPDACNGVRLILPGGESHGLDQNYSRRT
jgi:hypothetical protein